MVTPRFVAAALLLSRSSPRERLPRNDAGRGVRSWNPLDVPDLPQPAWWWLSKRLFFGRLLPQQQSAPVSGCLDEPNVLSFS
jgi:hypothetical protein